MHVCQHCLPIINGANISKASLYLPTETRAPEPTNGSIQRLDQDTRETNQYAGRGMWEKQCRGSKKERRPKSSSLSVSQDGKTHFCTPSSNIITFYPISFQFSSFFFLFLLELFPLSCKIRKIILLHTV